MGAAGRKRAGGAAGTVAKHRLCFQPPGQAWVPKRARCSSTGDEQQGGAGTGTLSQEGLAACLHPVPGGAHQVCGELSEATCWAASSLPQCLGLALETCLLQHGALPPAPPAPQLVGAGPSSVSFAAGSRRPTSPRRDRWPRPRRISGGCSGSTTPPSW